MATASQVTAFLWNLQNSVDRHVKLTYRSLWFLLSMIVNGGMQQPFAAGKNLLCPLKINLPTDALCVRPVAPATAWRHPLPNATTGTAGSPTGSLDVHISGLHQAPAPLGDLAPCNRCNAQKGQRWHSPRSTQHRGKPSQSPVSFAAMRGRCGCDRLLCIPQATFA